MSFTERRDVVIAPRRSPVRVRLAPSRKVLLIGAAPKVALSTAARRHTNVVVVCDTRFDVNAQVIDTLTFSD